MQERILASSMLHWLWVMICVPPPSISAILQAPAEVPCAKCSIETDVPMYRSKAIVILHMTPSSRILSAMVIL